MTTRLSDEVVFQLARVWCSECGRPSIYPDDAFMAHYETHYGRHDPIEFAKSSAKGGKK